MMPRKQLFDLSAEAGGNMRGNECALKRIEFVPVFWSIQPRGYLFLRGFCEESTESWEVGFTVSKRQVIYLVDLDFENLDIDFVEKSSDRYILGWVSKNCNSFRFDKASLFIIFCKRFILIGKISYERIWSIDASSSFLFNTDQHWNYQIH